MSESSQSTPSNPSESKPLNQSNKKWVKPLISVIVVSLFVWVGWKHLGELDRLLSVSPWLAISILAAFLLMRYLHGQTLRRTLGGLDCHIGRSEGFHLSMIIAYANLIVPRVGLGGPAVYLNRRYNLHYGEFASLLLPMVVVQFVCVGLLGVLVQVMLIVLRDQPVHWLVMLLFAGIAGGGLLALLIRVPTREQSANRLVRLISRLGASWNRLASQPGLLRYVTLLQLVMIFFRAGRLVLVFWAIGVEVDWLAILTTSLLADLTLLISITPGALGFREAAITYGMSIANIATDLSVSAGILDRIICALATVIVGQTSVWKLMKRQANAPADDESMGE